MPNEQTHMTSRLLESSVAGLDISPAQFELAASRYQDLGEWLVQQGIGEPDVYPQGSFRLGTVLRPSAGADFDIDLVFLRRLAKGSISQKELREQAEGLLRRYLDARGPQIGKPRLEEKGRCFTLAYPSDKFHMDVLPVIPDPDGNDTAVLLSDRDLFEWQHSNPIGYAEWFWGLMGDALDAGLERLALELKRDVESVPRWLVRTTLQRAVQLLKLHRNQFFVEHPDDQPASILITTLAARSFSGERDLLEAFRKIAIDLPLHVERCGNEWWVPNPAHEEENFADKWNTDPDRKKHFDEWCRALVVDLEAWGRSVGIDALVPVLGRSFGTAPVQAGAKDVAANLAAASAAGGLGVSSTGGISEQTSGVRVRPHRFHGE